MPEGRKRFPVRQRKWPLPKRDQRPGSDEIEKRVRRVRAARKEKGRLFFTGIGTMGFTGAGPAGEPVAAGFQLFAHVRPCHVLSGV